MGKLREVFLRGSSRKNEADEAAGSRPGERNPQAAFPQCTHDTLIKRSPSSCPTHLSTGSEPSKSRNFGRPRRWNPSRWSILPDRFLLAGNTDFPIAGPGGSRFVRPLDSFDVL